MNANGCMLFLSGRASENGASVLERVSISGAAPGSGPPVILPALPDIPKLSLSANMEPGSCSSCLPDPTAGGAAQKMLPAIRYGRCSYNGGGGQGLEPQLQERLSKLHGVRRATLQDGADDVGCGAESAEDAALTRRKRQDAEVSVLVCGG
jgi:hypothetical protein